MRKNCQKCGKRLAKKNKGGLCKDCYVRIPWNKGKPGSQEANGMRGKKHKKESIEKMKENMRDIHGENNPMYNHIHSKDAKEKMSKARAGKATIPEHSDETKRKMRISAIKYLEETVGISPRYNKFACKFFDYLNNKYNLKGQHAENGGEYFIKDLGYWLDYIDFENKIIIENNEKSHYKPKRIKKTKLKEKELRNYFKDFDIIITNIPRTKDYDSKRVNRIFEEQERIFITGRSKIS